MEGQGNTKEVYFSLYCHKCKWRDKMGDPEMTADGYSENDKCHECLENPYNYDSHKPVNYEAKKS